MLFSEFGFLLRWADFSGYYDIYFVGILKYKTCCPLTVLNFTCLFNLYLITLYL